MRVPILFAVMGCLYQFSGAWKTGALPPSIRSPANLSSLAARDLPTGMCNANTPCVNGACCGIDGTCGYSPKSCGNGCTSNCDAKAQCGPYANQDSQKCPLNVCCSEFGFCGSTKDFCNWKGCDTQYGGCGDVKRPSCSSGSSVSGRTVGYYESWSSTRQCQSVQPEDLNLDVFTHLNFAFAFFQPTTFQLAPMDSSSGALYNRFTGLKSKKQNLQTWISVGGWSFTDPGPTRTAFSDMVSTPATRKQFIDGLISFMATYGFDGVDLDWEYPAADDRGGKAADKENYVQLAKEMRAAFGSQYGISMTLPLSFWYLQHFDVVGIQDSLDWFNLMSYDLHGVWDADSKFIGPYVASHTNISEIDIGLDLLWRSGVSPGKIILGQAWYGRAFSLKDSTCNTPNGVCQFSGPAKAGPCSNSPGILNGREIQDIIKKNSLNPSYDKTAMVKWINWDTDQWVSYDDQETFQGKKDFANNRCLGGLMVWAMDQVDQSAPNGLGPVPDITPEQQKGVKKMGTTLDAASTCYTGDCSGKCKKGFHEVTQVIGQPSDLSTKSRCGLDKHKNQQHESICCPSATSMGKCQWRGWRGVGLPCNSGCEDGEVEVALNTGTLTQSCAGGVQSYCCEGFRPPPPVQKKESVWHKIGDDFRKVGHAIKSGFEKFGKDIENLAEGVLLDVAGKFVCRVLVPVVLGGVEVAEDIVPVAGEFADAAEIAATPAIVASCQKALDKLIAGAKGKKPAQAAKPIAGRPAAKPHSPAAEKPNSSTKDCKRKRGENPAGPACEQPTKPTPTDNKPSTQEKIERPPNEDTMPEKKQCGSNAYSKEDLIAAMTQGFKYRLSEPVTGQKSKNGITWQTAGKEQYPHVYKGYEVVQGLVKLADPRCEKARTELRLLEFPLMAGGTVFEGSKNAKVKDDRVIFAYGEAPNAPLYCGATTHTAASAPGQFVDCV